MVNDGYVHCGLGTFILDWGKLVVLIFYCKLIFQKFKEKLLHKMCRDSIYRAIVAIQLMVRTAR